ncbi:GMC family oxidoreductase N-terminal domain-containing protein [soil metagenome]
MRWVVVGAGAAGCVVAARLVEDPSAHVVVVEPGPDLTASTTPPAVTSLDYVAALREQDRLATTKAVRNAGGAVTDYVTGRGVGGSAAVNGLVMDLGDSAQYQAWGWHDVAEAAVRVRVPRQIVGEELFGVVDRALLSTRRAAHPVELSVRDGRRVTTAEAYLDCARADGHVDVVVGVGVDRVAFARGRATGVVLDDGTRLDADGVVLAAGALGSPAILLRSGVDHVPVGIGLQEHPSVTVTLRLRPGAPRAGVATGAAWSTGGVVVTTMNHTRTDDAVGPEYGALHVALVRPRSRGRVVLDGDGHPVAHFGQLASTYDVDQLIDGLQRVGEALEHPAFGDVVEVVFRDADGTPADFSARDGLADWVRSADGAWLHPAASCPMGTVVDDDGRLIGTANLFIVDASVFPEIPAAPTYLPTLMLAERLAPRVRRAPE